MGRKQQQFLFDEDTGTLWGEEWKDMPEFVQEDLKPVKTLLVHFESLDDLELFSKLIGRKIFSTAQSIWFPEEEVGRYSNKRYADES